MAEIVAEFLPEKGQGRQRAKINVGCHNEYWDAEVAQERHAHSTIARASPLLGC